MAGAARMEDLEAQIATETARLATSRNDAVCILRELEEDRARLLLDIETGREVLVSGTRERVRAGLSAEKAALACSYLRNAEGWQWEIGSWSTGAGEGLASMSRVYTLKLAQAWLHACVGDVARARALAAEIEADPNRLGRNFRAPIEELRTWLDARPTC